MKKLTRKTAPYILLSLASVLIWCGLYGKASLASWGVPVVYSGESLVGFGMIRGMMDGHSFGSGLLSVDRLNAPFAGQWEYWPMSEDFGVWLLGAAAQVLGLFEALNLFLLGSTVLSAGAFFYAARQTQVATALGMVGALIFAFSPFVGQQLSAGALPLVVIWPLPLMVLSIHWLNSHHFLLDDNWQLIFLVALALVVGAWQPVFGLIYCQLLLLTLIANGLTGYKRKAQLCGLMIFLVFLVSRLLNSSTFRLPKITPTSDTSLELSHLVIPGQPGYLGVIGVLALCALVFESIYLVLKKKSGQLNILAAMAGWVFLVGTTGGLGAMLATAGFPLAGFTGPYSALILVIGLLYFFIRLSRFFKAKKSWAAAAVLLLVAGAEVYCVANHRPDVALLVQQDQAFGRALEQALPKGSSVFQLPATAPPKSAPYLGVPVGMGQFEPLRPYLFTQDLKFSFPPNVSQGWESWKLQADSLGAPELIQQLQRQGFQGLVIHWTAYPDFAGILISDLRELGYKQIKTALPNRSMIAFDITKKELPKTPASP